MQRWTISLAVLAVSSLFAQSANAQFDRFEKFPLPRPEFVGHRDPAATEIQFRLIEKRTKFSGRVQITGVVKNRGTLAFESRPNQQAVHLYEGNRLVARQAFQNLAPGQEVRVSFTRNWSTSTEFPPVYKVMVIYDPDIRLDGNEKNDDSNLRNNQTSRPGEQINALFRRPTVKIPDRKFRVPLPRHRLLPR